MLLEESGITLDYVQIWFSSASIIMIDESVTLTNA